MKLSLDEVFVNWRANLDEARFAYENRIENIEDLVSSLYSLGFYKTHADSLQGRVVSVLVTKEGMKNSGKYKGWKGNVNKDYEDCVSRFYIEEVIDRIKGIKNINPDNSLQLNESMVDYLYGKYNFVTERMIIEMHTIGTEINSDYCRKILNNKENL